MTVHGGSRRERSDCANLIHTHPLATMRFLLLLLLLSGCDLFAPDRDTTIALTGRVLADGLPVVGLSVTLDRSLRLGAVAVARSTTRSDGTFSITHDPGDVSTLRTLQVNNEPYSPSYGVYQDSFVPGTRRDLGDIDVTRPPAP